MSRGISNYKCICGGNVTEQWDNGNLLLQCDNNDCCYPYPEELQTDTAKDIAENGVKNIYRDIVYYQCDETFYINIAINNGKNIYNSYLSEEELKKWIDSVIS